MSSVHTDVVEISFGHKDLKNYCEYRLYMNNLISALINLDTANYLSQSKDLQDATKGMSEVDRQLWVLTHFVKHGYNEGRKYRLKSTVPVMAAGEVTPDAPKPHRKHKSKKCDDIKESTSSDAHELIKQFQQCHSDDKGGVRDKCKTATPIKEKDARTKKNFFWEVTN